MSREAMEDGWCDWEYHSPLESSLLCCDCELIHEVDVRVVRYESLDSEVYEVVNDPNLEAQIRLRRRDDISPRRNTGWVYADDTSQDHVDETVKCKHEWVGLTDDVVFELADTNLYEGGKNFGVLAFARAIEQALKEKNKW